MDNDPVQLLGLAAALSQIRLGGSVLRCLQTAESVISSDLLNGRRIGLDDWDIECDAHPRRRYYDC